MRRRVYAIDFGLCFLYVRLGAWFSWLDKVVAQCLFIDDPVTAKLACPNDMCSSESCNVAWRQLISATVDISSEKCPGVFVVIACLSSCTDFLSIIAWVGGFEHN